MKTPLPFTNRLVNKRELKQLIYNAFLNYKNKLKGIIDGAEEKATVVKKAEEKAARRPSRRARPGCPSCCA